MLVTPGDWTYIYIHMYFRSPGVTSMSIDFFIVPAMDHYKSHIIWNSFRGMRSSGIQHGLSYSKLFKSSFNEMVFMQSLTVFCCPRSTVWEILYVTTIADFSTLSISLDKNFRLGLTSNWSGLLAYSTDQTILPARYQGVSISLVIIIFE
jgi:hypothetical protein